MFTLYVKNTLSPLMPMLVAGAQKNNVRLCLSPDSLINLVFKCLQVIW